jgi:hypothetical protein
MKHLLPSLSVNAAKAVLLASCALFLTHATSSASSLLSSGVDLGEAGPNHHNWAIFSLGGGVATDNMSNGAQVFGDIGLAGHATLDMSGGTKIYGTAYRRTTGNVNLSNGASITGGVVQGASTDAFLNQGVNDAMTASNAAFALSASVGYPTTISANSSLSLSGSGTVVLKLTDFVLSGGAKLTLQGSAGTTFIINVSRNFSLSNGANIGLSGGLSWDHVLFNVRGSGSTVTLSGGSQVMSGILLATNRTVSLENGASVSGEIIADKVTLSGGASVARPALVSP